MTLLTVISGGFDEYLVKDVSIMPGTARRIALLLIPGPVSFVSCDILCAMPCSSITII